MKAAQPAVTNEEQIAAVRSRAMPNDAVRRSRFIPHPSAFILLLVYLTLSLVYNAAVPLGEGPDEGGHFDYVLFLARAGRLPVQAYSPEQKSDVPGEGHQPPLAYLLALPAVAWLPPEGRLLPVTANPRFVWSGGDEPAAYVRGSGEYWPWRGTTLAWHLARVVSSLLGAATVVCTYMAAQAVQRGKEGGQQARQFSLQPSAFSLLAAALVALNPQFLFTSALVTNDALLTALSAGALWIAVKDGGRWTVVDPLLLGLLLGLALLTKQSAALLLPLLPLAAWRQAAGWRARLMYLALSGMVILAVAGWWYVRNAQLYGDALGLDAFRAEFTTQPWNWRDPAAWAGALAQLHESFWARFGWMSVRAPQRLYVAYALPVLAAVVGLAAQSLTKARGQESGISMGVTTFAASLPLAVWALPVLALLWTLSFALTAGLVAWQGRFLFPALPAIALLLARGLAYWAKGEGASARWLRGAALPLALSPFALAAALLPFTVIAPSYVWRTLPTAQAQAQLGTPAYLRFAENWKQGAELRGWRSDSGVRAGETLTVTLTWHALEQVPRDWTVFLHLLDARGEIVAENNSKPQNGAMPMRLWAAGDWIADPHPLALPPTLPPGTYRLRVGLYRPDKPDQRRQGIWDARGEFVGDEAILGEIQVRK